jgi:hypothetical protein
LAVGFRILIGLRLLDLALRRSPLTSPSPSISSASGTAAFFFADLVTGPKYPSCGLSRVSEGVGEGEMTLGVAGMGFEDDRDMVKGGKEGMRIAPVKSRPISVTRRSQEEVEWRCLSFREARIVVTEGNGGGEPVSSSGGDGAEQNCAASLKKVMVPLSVPLKWHTGLLGWWVMVKRGLTIKTTWNISHPCLSRAAYLAQCHMPASTERFGVKITVKTSILYN